MPEYGVVQRADGVYLDPSLQRPALMMAVDSILSNDNYFTGLAYPVLMRALYGVGPKAVPGEDGWLRFASGIAPFTPARRELYRAVRIDKGAAEYYFEPVYLADPDDPDGVGEPALLNIDEFVADMWGKGIRFGIDIGLVRAAIKAGGSERAVIARRLEPVQGADARIVEVTDDIHRSDAPRQLANGMLDLNSFQNRFPQIRKDVRLLQKIPRVAGTVGFELSGIQIEPAVPKDVDLQAYCGLGTAVERTPDGEFLVAKQSGFLMVDSRSNQISVGSKIVSHEGVSAKTTGNLELTGDYEEFGEVQEKRVIEGDSITVHADVYGKIVSRGGTIALNHNLIGGAAVNKLGDIRVRGMVSNATVQASNGEVVLERAENSVISGTRIRIDHAVNCEILGQDVTVAKAEGCAIGGRNIAIEAAGPRRQSEMVVVVQVPDPKNVDAVIAATAERVAQLAAAVQKQKAVLETLTSQPEVLKYLRLATGVRKNEITLTPEQMPMFQRLAQSVGPALKDIGKVSAAIRAGEAECVVGQELAAKLRAQRDEAGASQLSIAQVSGETRVRMIHFDPDGSTTYDLPVREIKARLRGIASSQILFAGSSGSFNWHSGTDDS
ncbi:hypothetical protein GCM10027321_33840 [Massilia terrae]